MTDTQIKGVVDYAAWIRGANTNAVHDQADKSATDLQVVAA